MQTLIKIRKRNGVLVEFDKKKIADAVFKAAKAIGGSDYERANYLAEIVANKLEAKYDGHDVPGVEDIQDIVERELMEHGHTSTAKTYILYRKERSEIRHARIKLLDGLMDELAFPINSLKVLRQRYLIKNEDGEIVETPKQLFERVATNIAQADKNYGGVAENTAKEFFEIMSTLKFLPNSPTLMNAGNELQQLSACFVLPIPDSINGIFDGIKYAALIHKSGGGTGFSFSRLRPKNSYVRSTKGVSSGPVSFMKVYNSATEVIKQGGKRRGANMGILRVDHPDVLEFINCKGVEGAFNNFNISIALTDKFMEAVQKDAKYDLIDPKMKKVVEQLRAKDVFNLIVTNAWKNGEPGLVFLDTMNKFNPTPEVGEFESTNPCGEQPLLPFESCNLGSVNLSRFVKEGKIDFDELGRVVRIGMHFLDNVIDMNRYPIPEIDEMTKANRKIGLGVMGFADMLIQLGIGYNTSQAVETAETVMEFIKKEADKASVILAETRGSFPTIEKSIYRGQKMRNATRTTIAPTGSIGMIADCSSGIEPLFAISFLRKHVLGDQEMFYGNKYFETIAKRRRFYSQDLMEKIAQSGSVKHVDEVPEDLKKIFVVAHDVDPDWHIEIQAAFQRHTDNAVSKTVNFGKSATTKDVEDAFLQAHTLGCKGITIYRDQSRNEQVINLDTSKHYKKKKPKEDDLCPECKTKLMFMEGCATCPECGFSKCSV